MTDNDLNKGKPTTNNYKAHNKILNKIPLKLTNDNKIEYEKWVK